MGYSFLKTLKKAAISTGTFIGLAGAAAAAGAMQNSEAMAAIWAVTGPGALVAVPLIAFGGRLLEDYLKHRND